MSRQIISTTRADGTRSTYALQPGSTVPMQLEALKPLKPPKIKADRRTYPKYKPGMSTAEYVAAYEAGNNSGMSCADFWQPLNTAPAAGYVGIDTVEHGDFDQIADDAPALPDVAELAPVAPAESEPVADAVPAELAPAAAPVDPVPAVPAILQAWQVVAAAASGQPGAETLAEAEALGLACLARYGQSHPAACAHLASFSAWHRAALAQIRAAAAPEPAAAGAPAADPAPWRGPDNAAARARVHAVHVRTARTAAAVAPNWHADGARMRRSVNAPGFDAASRQLRAAVAAALRAERAAAAADPVPVPAVAPADDGGFRARVEKAAAWIGTGRPTSRAFDSCFEMWDGDAVCVALLERAQRRPDTKLAANLWRYLARHHVEKVASERPRGLSLAEWSRQLVARSAPAELPPEPAPPAAPAAAAAPVHPRMAEALAILAAAVQPVDPAPVADAPAVVAEAAPDPAEVARLATAADAAHLPASDLRARAANMRAGVLQGLQWPGTVQDAAATLTLDRARVYEAAAALLDRTALLPGYLAHPLTAARAKLADLRAELIDETRTGRPDGFLQILIDANEKTAAQLAAAFAVFDAVGDGCELANTDGRRFCVLLPDASEPGRYRYSVFDAAGFSTHHAEDDAPAAVADAARQGFTQAAPGVLDRLAAGAEWARGMAVAAVIQAQASGLMTWQAAHAELDRIHAEHAPAAAAPVVAEAVADAMAAAPPAGPVRTARDGVDDRAARLAALLVGIIGTDPARLAPALRRESARVAAAAESVPGRIADGYRRTARALADMATAEHARAAPDLDTLAPDAPRPDPAALVAELDQITAAARDRIGGRTGSELSAMTPAELARRHAILQQLPTFAEERQAARQRIAARLAARQARPAPARAAPPADGWRTIAARPAPAGAFAGFAVQAPGAPCSDIGAAAMLPAAAPAGWRWRPDAPVWRGLQPAGAFAAPIGAAGGTRCSDIGADINPAARRCHHVENLECQISQPTPPAAPSSSFRTAWSSRPLSCCVTQQAGRLTSTLHRSWPSVPPAGLTPGCSLTAQKTTPPDCWPRGTRSTWLQVARVMPSWTISSAKRRQKISAAAGSATRRAGRDGRRRTMSTRPTAGAARIRHPAADSGPPRVATSAHRYRAGGAPPARSRAEGLHSHPPRVVAFTHWSRNGNFPYR